MATNASLGQALQQAPKAAPDYSGYTPQVQQMLLHGGQPGYDAYGVPLANGPGSTPWWTDQQAQNPNPGAAGQDYTAQQNGPSAGAGINAQYASTLQALGYTGDPNDQASLQNFLQSKGLTSKTSFNDTGGAGSQISALFDQGGNQVGGTQRQYASDLNNDAFLAMMLGGAGFAGAGAAGAFSGAGAFGSGAAAGAGGVAPAGIGGASGGLAGVDPTIATQVGNAVAGSMAPAGSAAGSAGLSSADAAALYGSGGYGAAATPAELAAGGGAASAGLSGLGNAGTDVASTGSDAHFYQPQAGGTGVQDLGNMGGAGSSPVPSMSTAGGSGGLLNGLQSALQNQNGTGLSSLGQGLVGLGVGAATGAFGSGNTGLLNNVNYQNAATAQGQSGRTNQTNAQGSLTYNQNGVDAQGNPTYSQNVALNAPYQQNLNSALGNQGTALGNLQNYNSSLAKNYANAPSIYGDAGSQAGLVKQAQDAAYNQQTSYLDPQYAQMQKQLQAQLANQGVTYGSDAYNAANTQFGSQQNQAYGTARDSAIAQGDAYANTLFNQNLQANQQYNANLNNQGTNYQNLSGNALSGVVQNPTFAAPPAQTNYLGAAQLQGGANLNQYNAQIGNTNNLTNGLTGLAGAALGNSQFWNGLGGLFSGG